MDRMSLVRNVMHGRCRLDDEWAFTWWQRWLYTAKSVVCILLNRTYSGKEFDWIGKYVVVGMHSFHKFFNSEFGVDDASFVNITVGYGLHNWAYYEMSDGWV